MCMSPRTVLANNYPVPLSLVLGGVLLYYRVPILKHYGLREMGGYCRIDKILVLLYYDVAVLNMLFGIVALLRTLLFVVLYETLQI